MVTDFFCRGILREPRIIVGVAVSTELCQTAQQVQGLAATSTVALGRLLTATVLTGMIRDRVNLLSLQVVCNGRFKQVFADMTHKGAVRGYVRPPDLAMPPLSEAARLGRRSIAHAIGEGSLSVIRTHDGDVFGQSATDLVSGEIDEDVANFLATSDQIPSLTFIDVLLDENNRVAQAGGIIAQAMPGADSGQLRQMADSLRDSRFSKSLSSQQPHATTILKHLFPETDVLESDVTFRWECRCSTERVMTSLKMLEPADLADLVNSGQSVTATCDFCNARYRVGPDKIRQAFSATLKAFDQ